MGATTAPDPVDAVIALQPQIRAAADQTERDRKPTPEIIRALLDAGLFDLIKPKSIGGAEVDPITMMRVIEEASHADASIGWCVGIGVGTSIMAGSVSEAVAREVFAPKTVQGGAFAPSGRARLEDGGLRVTGRWQFASGSPHCSWLSGGTIVFDGDAPRMMSPDMPDWRMPLFPRADVEIIDTWHTGGMRGTGSHDIAVQDIFVPDEHIVSMGRTEPKQSGPLYRYPIIGFLALTIAPVATGMARRAIDETLELAQTKVALGTRKTVKDRAIAQHLLAEAEAELRAGRAFMYEAAHEIWDTLLRGDTATLQQRAMLRLSCVHATNASVKAVDTAYRMGGGTAIYEGSVLQRITRDVHTVTQHVQLSSNNYEAVGRVLMGLDPGPFPF